MKTVAMLGCGVVLLFVAPGVRAEEGGDEPVRRDPGKMFERMDKDGNGSISLEEFTAVRLEQIKANFARIDRDGDGALSKAEMRRAHRQGPPMGRRPGDGEEPQGERMGPPEGEERAPAWRQRPQRDGDQSGPRPKRGNRPAPPPNEDAE